MLTVGVDLAAADVRSALASVRWTTSSAVVESVVVGVSDDQIVAEALEADKSGIDCPLGWPDPFVSFVVAHRDGHVEPVSAGAAGSDEAVGGAGAAAASAAWRRRLAYRLTDEVVRATTGLIPLSVSADRIGHAAFRAAGLLALLAAAGADVDRSGSGAVVEVYPAASLMRWGLIHRGYKRAGGEDRHAMLVDTLLAAAPWLSLGANERLCRTSHDALDAVVAALSARAAALGLATRPDTDQLPRARTEGWISLPTTPLADLAAET